MRNAGSDYSSMGPKAIPLVPLRTPQRQQDRYEAAIQISTLLCRKRVIANPDGFALACR